MILFFRGKAATGKSTATALCAQRLSAAIVIKDSVFDGFLKKVALPPSERRLFLFTCSNDAIWERRIQARIDSPEAPNQSFKSVRAAKAHYAAYAIVPLKGEHLVDSVKTPEQLVDSLCKRLDAGDDTARSKEACIF